MTNVFMKLLSFSQVTASFSSLTVFSIILVPQHLDLRPMI